MSQYQPAGQVPSDLGNASGQYPGQLGYAPEPQKSNALAITALVLGILALLSFWTLVGGYLLGAVAIVVGIVALRRANSGRAGGRAASMEACRVWAARAGRLGMRGVHRLDR